MIIVVIIIHWGSGPFAASSFGPGLLGWRLLLGRRRLLDRRRGSGLLGLCCPALGRGRGLKLRSTVGLMWGLCGASRNLQQSWSGKTMMFESVKTYSL